MKHRIKSKNWYKRQLSIAVKTVGGQESDNLELTSQLSIALARIKKLEKGIDNAKVLWTKGVEAPAVMHNAIINQKVVQTLQNIKNGEDVKQFLK